MADISLTTSGRLCVRKLMLSAAIVALSFTAATAGQSVLYIGDSISRGATPYLSKYFAAIGDRLLHNPGNAESSRNGAAHIVSWLNSAAYGVTHFARVIVNFGIWDTSLSAPVPIGEYFRDLCYIINEIHLRQPHAAITFLNTTPVPTKSNHSEALVRRYNQVAALLVGRLASKGVPVSVLDVNSYMLKYEAEYQLPHNVHWTPKGYQILAAGIWRGIGPAATAAAHHVATATSSRTKNKR